MPPESPSESVPVKKIEKKLAKKPAKKPSPPPRRLIEDYDDFIEHDFDDDIDFD